MFAEYNPETDTIYLNENKIEKLDEAEILHEVQHKIQLIEGFSEGSSMDFWVGVLSRTMELNNAAQNILDEIESEHGKELAKRAVRFGEVMQRIVDGDESETTRPDIDRKKVAFVEGKFRAADEDGIDEVAKEKGYSQKLYHQTGGDFNVFDTEHQKAGKHDPEMPTGTFLKPTDADIGLEGDKQMELFTKMENRLEFNNRDEAVRFWKKNVPGYSEAIRNIDRINERYSREVARAGMEVSEYKKEWRRNNPDADSRELYNDAEFQRLDEAEDIIVEEWNNASNEASLEAKNLIDDYMRDSGYDGVVVDNDKGSFGRTVKTYIVFDSSQMKSTDTVTYDDSGNEIPISARFDSSKKDIRYSLPENKNTVADKTNSDIRLIVDKLNNNESISIDDIENASQIKKLLEEAFAQPETDKINTQERIELRNTIANKLLNNGSAILDSNGKVRYNGIVKRGKRVDIVIGLSAAGKSSVLVNPLSQLYSSRIIDSDMAKEELPEFNNGIGANAVHKESKRIIDSVYDQTLANGDNIVYPIVGGGDPTKLTERIKQLKELGYSVFLHLNELPNNKAIARSLNRYLEEGRFIPPRVIYNYGDTPTQNFNDIINMEGLIDGYSHYSNDVERGKSPQLVKISENVREFDGREPSWRSHTGRKSEENAQGDGNRRVSYSLPEHPTPLQIGDAYKNGEITSDEYVDRINELWEETGKAEGTIKPGEIVEPPNKRVPTPKSVSDGTKVRQFARTILESGYATPEMEAYLKELILEGDYSYIPTSNKKSIAKAERNIENQGYQNAVSNWQRSLSKSTVDADTVATGEALLKMAFDQHNAVDIVNLTADLAELGTRMGQAVQAFSLLKRMGGISQLVYLQRSVNKINEDLKQRFKGSKKDAPVVKMNEKLAERLAKAETEGEKEVIYGRIVKDIADQVPSTFLDKWNAWRYMAMLFNPTTHIRNVLGNGIFLPVVRMKDLIALGGEKIFVKAEDRTKVLKVKQEYQDFAEKDFVKIESMLTGTGKYNPSDNIRDEMAVFKNKILEGLRKFNFTALEKEDAIFLKRHYRHALGSFLQARNIDLKNMSNAQLLAAREYAFNEALKATYRDASKVANMLSQLSKTSKFANVLVEGVLPFKKTPINILKRGVEYSPIGIIKTLSKGIYDLKKGEFNAAQFIDGLAANAIGSIPFVLGVFLANIGVAKGGFDDEEGIDKLMGKQEYSIRIGDTSYTIDWLAPASIPFFMGVAISEYEADKDGDFLSNLYDFGIKGFEPILNLSMLSGVNDMIDSVSYAEDAENLPQLIGSGISSYFSQALPTIFGKTANIFDDTKRTRYVDKTSNVPEIVQKALDKIASKTPFASKSRAEYINAWGETKYTGNFFQRFFQQYVSPGYASTVDQSAISEECMRLYRETGEKSVVPSTPAKYFTLKGNRRDLSKEEYYAFATFRGHTSADLVNEAINNAEYKKLTDEQKVKVITDIYDYVGALAKSQLSYSYEEIAAMEGGEDVLTPSKWNKLNDKAKQLLVKEYFLDGTKGKAYKQAQSGKSVVDFYIKKVKSDSKK